MRAVVVDRWMEPSDLAVREVPDPEIGPGMLGVEVRAAGCNFFDILMAKGQYQVKPPFPFVPGAELAGVVTAVGPDVRGFRTGDRVLAAVPLGAFAERAAVPARAAMRMPDGMSFGEGAAFPIVYPTSYAGLLFRAGLRPDENLLVHAAAGGVGIAAVQIGKALGARVIATAGGPEKLEIAKRAGADVVIDYKSGDWVEAVKQATGGRGADVIYDSVGGDITDEAAHIGGLQSGFFNQTSGTTNSEVHLYGISGATFERGARWGVQANYFPSCARWTEKNWVWAW